MVDIKETVNLNGNITIKDATGNDVVAAYINASIDGSNLSGNVSINVRDKALLQGDNLVNSAGETPAQQYEEFAQLMKNKAIELGFNIFGGQAPDAPQNLTASGTTENGTVLNWK